MCPGRMIGPVLGTLSREREYKDVSPPHCPKENLSSPKSCCTIFQCLCVLLLQVAFLKLDIDDEATQEAVQTYEVSSVVSL